MAEGINTHFVRLSRGSVYSFKALLSVWRNNIDYIVRSLFVETRFRYVSVSQLYCFEIAAFEDIGCGQPRVMYGHVLRNLRVGTRRPQNLGRFESLQSSFL